MIDIRSATAPDMMVAAVPQNMSWNRKKVRLQSPAEPKNRRSGCQPRRPEALVPEHEHVAEGAEDDR